MNNSLLQIYEVLGGIYGGMVAGLIVDALSLLRYIFKSKPVNIALDILLSLITGGIFALTLYRLSSGNFTLYMLAVFFIGFFTVRHFTGCLFREIIHRIFKEKNKKKSGKA
ncbi:MAG: hypothetical protein IJA35_01365 [Clostridia bacterium]|nr:hypothetical protein [Clostridia bacterium]